MSTITKSLEQTIEELRSLITEKNSELAIYEKVLEMERSKGRATSGTSAATRPAPVAVVQRLVEEAEPEAPPAKPVAAPSSGSQNSADSGVAFTGNKTAFIAAVLASRGASGATPKEVGEVFTARKISRSDNLIYNTLSALVKQKKLERKDGRYYPIEARRAAAKKK